MWIFPSASLSRFYMAKFELEKERLKFASCIKPKLLFPGDLGRDQERAPDFSHLKSHWSGIRLTATIILSSNSNIRPIFQ
jgi:hypothetical protein